MRAVIATDYCPPDQLTVADLPIPRPGPGQLQVRVAAAAINPADVRLPRGDFRDFVDLTFPHVVGNDFAGTVTETGPGVTAYAVGDEIFGVAVPRALRGMASATRPSVGTGMLAEYAVIEADTALVAHRPPGLAAEDAAALATAGFTAVAVLGAGAFRPGETALVVGATGGAGTAIVPVLANAGVRVLATATADDEEILRKLGAAEIIRYRETDTADETLRRYPAGIDVVVNATLPGDGLAGIARTLRPGGRLVTITLPAPTPADLDRPDLTVTAVLDMDGVHGGMAATARLAESGVLPATIGRRYTLAEGPQACADFAALHTTGKLVVLL
ncbi:NADP-dependent oxidoreductase [Hamadaea tsunoensis]|uniref:NADP-dependent oxidoreductase n=1 Tax=Hamadaea tsunoensis TaxID=53368 RepID=UPI0004213622|nr:NADP-dependent oxidoreductase [Hamadaea tsunoensis]